MPTPESPPTHRGRRFRSGAFTSQDQPASPSDEILPTHSPLTTRVEIPILPQSPPQPPVTGADHNSRLVKRVEYLILCPRFPLLGFHSAAVDGRTKIGPTALPASSREQYSGLRNFRVGEFVEIHGCEAHRFVLDASFRELAAEVIRKHSRRELVRLAGALAEAIRFEDFTAWGQAGIRAQLLDTATSRQAMGFVTEDDDHSCTFSMWSRRRSRARCPLPSMCATSASHILPLRRVR
jgi:hypothetical protein